MYNTDFGTDLSAFGFRTSLVRPLFPHVVPYRLPFHYYLSPVFSCAPSYLVFCLCLLYISDGLSTSHPVCLYLSCLWTYLLDTNRAFPPFSLPFCVPSRSVFSRFQSFSISPEPSCLFFVLPHLTSSPTTASIPFYFSNPLPSLVVLRSCNDYVPPVSHHIS